MLVEEIFIKTNILLDMARKYSDDIYKQMHYISTSSDYPDDIKLNALKSLIDEQIEKESNDASNP